MDSPTIISQEHLAYVSYGSGPDTLVFLHGFGASHKSWQPISELIPLELYTCLFIDLKGFGASPKPRDGRYSLVDQAAMVTSLLENIGVSAVTLIGHSYGGLVAAILAAKPEGLEFLIERLILIDTPLDVNTIPFFVRYLRTPIINGLSMEWIRSRAGARHVLRRLYYDDSKITEQTINNYQQFYQSSGTSYSFIKAARQIIPDSIAQWQHSIQAIKCPVLMIWGAQDDIVSSEEAENIATSRSNIHIIKIEECGHIPHEEQAERTWQVMKKFMTNK